MSLGTILPEKVCPLGQRFLSLWLCFRSVSSVSVFLRADNYQQFAGIVRFPKQRRSKQSMMKRALIVMSLLGMGLVAGFVVFVASSADDRLKASEDDPNCIWPYSSGTLTLEYRWGTGSVGPGTAWRTAYEDAVDGWNDLDTNVEWEHSNYGDNTLNSYSVDDNQAGFNQPYCSSGSNPVRVMNDSWGNSYYYPTMDDRRSTATHEMGHAMGLWHSTDNDDVMYPSCCDVTSPSSGDEDAVNDMY